MLRRTDFLNCSKIFLTSSGHVLGCCLDGYFDVLFFERSLKHGGFEPLVPSSAPGSQPTFIVTQSGQDLGDGSHVLLLAALGSGFDHILTLL